MEARGDKSYNTVTLFGFHVNLLYELQPERCTVTGILMTPAVKLTTHQEERTYRAVCVCVWVCVWVGLQQLFYINTLYISFPPAVAGVELASLAIKCLSVTYTHMHAHINSSLHPDRIINITHIPTQLLSGDCGSGCCVH